MKMKYYLRGLATGLVVAAVLMSLSFGGRQTMSDEEVKERAAKLGMVMAGTTLAGTPKPGEEPTATKEPGQSEDSAGAQVEKDNTQTSQETAGLEETGEQPGTDDTQTSQETVSPEETEKPQGTEPTESTLETEESQAPAPSAESGEMVTITIYRGNSSNTVARYLEQAGLVEDAVEYDAYLCSHGYDKSISVGVFEIPMGSSREEIAKIITGRK